MLEAERAMHVGSSKVDSLISKAVQGCEVSTGVTQKACNNKKGLDNTRGAY